MRRAIALSPLVTAVATVAGVAAAVVALAACGGGDASTPDLCDGRPCLTAVADANDWAAIRAPYTGPPCDLVEDAKYLLPASSDAALAATVYQDVQVHRLHIDFLRK